jgi:pilus assembly protein CpaF
MSESLRAELFNHDDLAELEPVARRLALRRLALEAGIPDAASAAVELADEVDRFGVLTALMDDDEVTDILVNGPHEIWVDQAGRLSQTDIRFAGPEALLSYVQRLVGRAGARLDRSHPIADARLPDGSRIHAVLPPVAPEGPLVSIRRFPSRRFELDDLVARSMLDADEARRLTAFVEERRTIVVSGRTGTGKSTLLDALIRAVPTDERIVTIEELPELRSATEHRVSLVARGPNVEGKGAISLDQLVRAALRMRPDRIVVGEVRGPETLVAIEAMSTGHVGSMLTVHARSAAAVPDRLLTLALQAASGASEGSLRRQIEEAIDVVVHLDRRAGRRRVASICTFD